MEQVGVFLLATMREPTATDVAGRGPCWWCFVLQDAWNSPEQAATKLQEFLVQRAHEASGTSSFAARIITGTLRACPRHFTDPLIRRNLELLSVAATLGPVGVA